MPELQLSRYARILPAGPDSIYWTTETRQGYWVEPHAGEIAALLAGPAAERPAIGKYVNSEAVLAGLIQRGLVERMDGPPALVELCRESGVSPQYLKRDRWQKGATVFDLGCGHGAFLRTALEALGIAAGGNGALRAAVVSDYLDPRLDEFDAEARRSGCAWLPVKLAGEEVWIGPVFDAGAGSCWRCLKPRLQENAWLRSQIAPGGAALTATYASEARLQAAAEFAAQAAGRWLLEIAAPVEGKIWCFTWGTLRSQAHEVMRRPNCPECRWPASTEAETIARLEKAASPVTGIVRRLERRDLTEAPAVFTYGAVHVAALPPLGLRIPGAVLRPGVCSGRGWTPEQARMACLAEAVERYSQQFRGDEPRIAARAADLGAQAMTPDRLLLFSERQYAERDAWNRTHGPDEAVPERFDESEEIEWAAGRSLLDGEPRYLPMALAAQYYRPPGKRWIGDADSTGCAAGSTREQAILSALFELMERDALAIWWFHALVRPCFRGDRLPDEPSRTACRQLEEAGWTVAFADITTDLGIPVVLATGVREGKWIRGSACHVDPAAAMKHAIAELWQLSRGAPRPSAPPRFLEGGRPPAWRDAAPESAEEAIAKCCARLAEAGLEAAAFELTRPEIGFPVVRVVAPGLRPVKPRFAPGRLYDVPVKLGWLTEARRESEFPTSSA